MEGSYAECLSLGAQNREYARSEYKEKVFIRLQSDSFGCKSLGFRRKPVRFPY